MGPRGRGGWGFGPWGFGWGCETPQSGPGFKWRFYDRGDLKYVILRLLKERPMHGYEVMRALEEESGGWYRASAGSVYPTLQMLEDQGYVAVKEEDGKKVYSITPEGQKYLNENSRVVDEIIDRVSDFTSGIFREGMSDLTRSFGRVANITFERAVRFRGNQEVIQQMKEILEKAARDLEGVQPRSDRS